MPHKAKQDQGDQSAKTIHKNLSDGSFILFDLETTGGLPDKNGITEVYAMLWHKGQILDSFYSMVNPQMLIPPLVRRITGISNQMVQNAPTIDEVMPKLLDFLGNHILVSHNILCDLRFLRFYGEKICQKPVSNFFLCTHLLTEKLLPEAPDKSLEGLARFVGCEPKETHRAKEDAQMTLELFKHLLIKLKEKSIQTIIDAIRFQGDTDSALRLGWSVSEKSLRSLPYGPGLLKFYDAHQNLIFFTSTKSLKKEAFALKNYAALPKQLMKLILRANSVAFELTDHFPAAVISEAKLLTHHPLKVQPHQWHQRWINTLMMKKKTKDKSVLISIGPAETDCTLILGPILDRAKAQKHLAHLAEFIPGYNSRKHAVWPIDRTPLLEACLTKNSEGLLKKLQNKKFSLKYLFSRRYRQDLTKQQEEIQKLKNHLAAFKEYPSLLQTNGVITAPLDGDQAVYDVYPIEGSIIKAPVKASGSFHDWLTTKEGKKVFSRLERLHQTRKLPARQALDVNLLNATLWLVYGSGKRVWKYQYHSFEEIRQIKEGLKSEGKQASH